MQAVQNDGRTDRTARTREKIIEALFLLVGEGTLRPRGEEIADKAGVAVRTLFRHFDDMEGLVNAARAHLSELLDTPIDTTPLQGSLEERARAFGQQQGEIFDRIRNYLLFYATNARTIKDANTIRSSTAQAQRLRIWSALPECAAAIPVARQTVEAIYSFQHWDQLRYEQELSVDEALDAITWSVTSLLGAGGRNLEG
jgi:TetR/AcrR family transcriptional regulator, regulator of autoinduction and epiphytic fitness